MILCCIILPYCVHVHHVSGWMLFICTLLFTSFIFIFISVRSRMCLVCEFTYECFVRIFGSFGISVTYMHRMESTQYRVAFVCVIHQEQYIQSVLSSHMPVNGAQFTFTREKCAKYYEITYIHSLNRPNNTNKAYAHFKVNVWNNPIHCAVNFYNSLVF